MPSFVLDGPVPEFLTQVDAARPVVELDGLVASWQSGQFPECRGLSEPELQHLATDRPDVAGLIELGPQWRSCVPR